MNGKYTVNQAIWLAASLYAYTRYENGEDETELGYCLKASELKEIAQKFAKSDVQVARIHQHLNGDHDNCSHKYLRRLVTENGNPVFRVTANGEFGGEKEKPDDIEIEGYIDYAGKKYSMKDVFEFMEIDYPVIINTYLRNECTHWMIAGNPTKYDVINAFAELGKVDWRQTFNANVGDIVYIYVSDSIKEIRYKCRVNKTELQEPEIEDSKFNLSGEFDGSYGRYIELEPIKQYSGFKYGRDELLKHGFKTLMGPMRVPDELQKYLDSLEYDSVEKEKELDTEMSNNSVLDKNMILYGPPGTGKTYNSAIYAVAICDGKSVEELTDYDAVMDRFNQLKKEGRVAFTTFHQSYGYEEFIEGIKPVMNEEGTDISYEIEPGAFKRFCEMAKTPANVEVNPEAKIWFVRLEKKGANSVKEECYRDNKLIIDDNGKDDWYAVNYFVNTMKVGDYVVSYAGDNVYIDAIGIIKSDVAESVDESQLNPVKQYTREVEWSTFAERVNVREINSGKYLPNFMSELKYMKLSELLRLLPDTEKEDKPCVFIIDEINRGNISKIFGELITLIENTKREGEPEAASAVLPYSGENFSVPSNVYILGTMNTADRSIALMDTALRRRFRFIEMMPDADVLRKIHANMVETVDVAAILETINERITYLYDREHTIGHAFFTGLRGDDATLENLAGIFEKSVIPLLQEYFYEDYQKIQLILGDNAKSSDDYKFIKDEKVVAKNIFKGNVEDVIDLPEKKYSINKDAFSKATSYREII